MFNDESAGAAFQVGEAEGGIHDPFYPGIPRPFRPFGEETENTVETTSKSATFSGIVIEAKKTADTTRGVQLEISFQGGEKKSVFIPFPSGKGWYFTFLSLSHGTYKGKDGEPINYSFLTINFARVARKAPKNPFWIPREPVIR